MKQGSETCRALIDLGSLYKSEDETSELFLRSKKLLSHCGDEKGLYFVAQGHGFIPEYQNKFSENLGAVGAISLAKTIKKECPQLAVKAINISTKNAPEIIADKILAELLYGGDQIDVSIDDKGDRYLLDMVPYQQTTQHWKPLNEKDVVVASGGARGVTASCLIELAKQTPLRMAILSRSELKFDQPKYQDFQDQKQLMAALFAEAKEQGVKPQPKEIQAQVQKILREREVKGNIKALEDLGTEVKYLAVDVSNKDGLAKALQEVRSEWGSIKGLVHGAGVLADKLIKDKTLDDFNWVYKTKVDGFKHLLDLCKNDPLSHVCAFSSVAGRVGNFGQSDYAMANEMLNKMCQSLQVHKPDMVVKSLAWGPWDGGMVNDSLKRHFAEQGIQVIPLDEGAKIFVNQIQTSDKQVEIVIGSAMKPKLDSKPKESKHSILVSEASHSYLNSHRVKGKVVVPVVLMLEWIERITKANSRNLSIQGIKVRKGIILDSFESGEWITLTVTPEGDQSSVAISYGDKVCFEAKLSPSNGNSKGELPQIDGSWARSKSPYEDALFHGQDFQVIKKLSGTSAKGCKGVLSVPRSLDGLDSSWSTNCAVMDGGLQLAVTWFRDETKMASLPTDIESFQVYSQPKFGQDVTCYLTLKQKSSLKSQWDIDYVDQGGQHLAKISGLSIHAVPTGY